MLTRAQRKALCRIRHPGKVEVIQRILCHGSYHRIALIGNHLVLLDHPHIPDDEDAEAVLAALAGKYERIDNCRCHQVLKEWRKCQRDVRWVRHLPEHLMNPRLARIERGRTRVGRLPASFSRKGYQDQILLETVYGRLLPELKAFIHQLYPSKSREVRLQLTTTTFQPTLIVSTTASTSHLAAEFALDVNLCHIKTVLGKIPLRTGNYLHYQAQRLGPDLFAAQSFELDIGLTYGKRSTCFLMRAGDDWTCTPLIF